MNCYHDFFRVNYCHHFHCSKCGTCQSKNDCILTELKSKFLSQTKYILDLFDNPMWKESITFFVNKERDRIRNIVIDNLTLPRTSKNSLSSKGQGYKEAIDVTKKSLLIYIGENDMYQTNEVKGNSSHN